MQSANVTLNFDSTPEKAGRSILSFVTPNIKRNIFPQPDQDCSLCFDGHVNTTLKKSAKRQLDNDDVSLPKRRRHNDDVKTVVNILTQNDHLIADGSRTYSLPTVQGKHQDLKSISPQILADLVEGHYDGVIDSFRIIDCRYPYEFEGGHVRGAENMYLHETILTLLQNPTTEKQVLIFHCEFSSERGPKMLRFLRSKDRELNKENYPALNFPEIYLLDGGYKAFFGENPELCDPISYRPMLHSDHSTDLRHFRAKSKSWTAGEKRRTISKRPKK
ncbi:M-phase inducer phosphatase-like [Mytilus californianus]|uniref:M-phase inducer phosphatase-like n=1 Tax=Mytilus californianus TaxID=6549 RepID=UPI002246F541|nr:M-phase inducer phosphatase-like [Mytilus californianus]